MSFSEKAYNWYANLLPTRTRKMKVRGKRIGVRPTQRYAAFWDKYSSGKWEPETLEVLSRFLHQDSYYVDVGAWIGPTVLYAVSRGAHVTAFEPDNVAYEELRSNLNCNSWAERVTVVRAALARGKGIATLRSNSFGNSESSITAAKVERKAAVVAFDLEQECEMISAEDTASEYRFSDADLIKVDIEGGEYPLLPYLIPALGASTPLLISFHPDSLGVGEPPELRTELRKQEGLSMISCLSAYYPHRVRRDGIRLVSWKKLEAEQSSGKWLNGAYLFTRSPNQGAIGT